MANMIGRLGVVLGLDSAEFVMGIDRAGKKLEQFAAKADEYGKYAATSFAVLSVAALKFADDISDVAQANDVAIDTVIKLRAALESSGGSADKAGVMLSAFTKFIDTAASGSFEAQKAFKAVGVSLKDIGTLSQEELLGKALKGLENIEDPITRGARAMDLFTKAAKGVAFDTFAQQMQATNKATNEQIEAVKEGAKTWDNFASIIRKLQLAFVEALGPSLRAINNQMSEDVFPKLTMLNKVLNFIASNAFSASQAIDALGKGMENMAGRSLIMQTYGESAKGFAEMEKLNDEYFKFLDNQRKAQEQFDRELSGVKQGGSGRGMLGYEQFGKAPILRETIAGVDSKAESLKAKQEAERKRQQAETEAALKRQLSLLEKGYAEEQNAIKESASEWARYVDVQAKTAESQIQYFRLSNQQLDRDREITLLQKNSLQLRSYEINYAEQILSIRNKYADRIYEIENQENLTREKKIEFMQREEALRDKSISQAREVLDIARQESEGSFQKGFGKGFDEFVRNMPNQLELGRQTFNTLMSSMESALQNFVRTGKFSFKDFARSLIQDMIMIQARAQMMSMMKGIWSMFGGGTPSVDLGYGGGSAGAVGISGFANGGSPPVGRASLVGERGPELFVPRTAGTIIPNNQLASAMGGGQTVNYNGPYIANMSAIDTQSGAQFLAKNKQAVWATYQSANRSIPVTR